MTSGLAARGTDRITEIADGVYAYLQLPGGWCLSNSGIVVSPDGAVVIDTLATESRNRRLVAAVDGLAPGSHRTVVNTHFHGDHHFGNHLFGPQATIIAHERARTEMDEAGLALTQLWPQVEWGDVRVTLPSVTFTDRLRLHIGDRAAELIHFGPAHTTNDAVVWLPQDKILFAGDIVLSGATPFNLMGSVEGALRVIGELAQLGAETVVCGHGPLTGPEVFAQTTAYLTWIQQLAAEGSADGVGPLEAARRAELGEFAGLIDSERLVGNLYRAYAEQGAAPRDSEFGAPLDVIAAFDDMVSYNDGQVPECLA
ncbi:MULTISPECIES: MBL fold metallo-hydrolase [unclassified Mycobacterium]|uniref:MBL fold metallo-hydrolase n=1 Tax=unclassified Mycobacterium TaxID=2642494 RepID=UPI001BAF2B23|nr:MULTISPECIES: MBL fold metallo-hydrolase [unclassified Mycobacterium]